MVLILTIFNFPISTSWWFVSDTEMLLNYVHSITKDKWIEKEPFWEFSTNSWKNSVAIDLNYRKSLCLFPSPPDAGCTTEKWSGMLDIRSQLGRLDIKFKKCTRSIQTEWYQRSKDSILRLFSFAIKIPKIPKVLLDLRRWNQILS